jgi:hypothetical protein
MSSTSFLSTVPLKTRFVEPQPNANMFEIDFFKLTSPFFIGVSQIGHFIVPSDQNELRSNPSIEAGQKQT